MCAFPGALQPPLWGQCNWHTFSLLPVISPAPEFLNFYVPVHLSKATKPELTAFITHVGP